MCLLLCPSVLKSLFFFFFQVVCKLLSLFSDEVYSQLLDWIYKFSRNTKISYRVFALDLISELLAVPKRTPPEGEATMYIFLSGKLSYIISHLKSMQSVLVTLLCLLCIVSVVVP